MFPSPQLFDILKKDGSSNCGQTNQLTIDDEFAPAPAPAPAPDHEATSSLPVPLIEFRDVSFFYPQNPNRWVLRHFNLRLFHGTTTALLGASGCGKTTVLELLLRLGVTALGCFSRNVYASMRFDSDPTICSHGLGFTNLKLVLSSLRDETCATWKPKTYVPGLR